MTNINARILAGDLPTWEQMSDLDKGAALLHDHKRSYEGAAYAAEIKPGPIVGCDRWEASRPHRDEPALDRPVVDAHLPTADIAA